MRKQRRRSAYHRLCFRYTDSTISLLPKSEISSLLAIFYGCTARFVWDQVKYPEDHFSQNEAHLGFLLASQTLSCSISDVCLILCNMFLGLFEYLNPSARLLECVCNVSFGHLGSAFPSEVLHRTLSLVVAHQTFL